MRFKLFSVYSICFQNQVERDSYSFHEIKIFHNSMKNPHNRRGKNDFSLCYKRERAQRRKRPTTGNLWRLIICEIEANTEIASLKEKIMSQHAENLGASILRRIVCVTSSEHSYFNGKPKTDLNNLWYRNTQRVSYCVV